MTELDIIRLHDQQLKLLNEKIDLINRRVDAIVQLIRIGAEK